MPAILWNVSWFEIVLVAILAVVVFGGRLPQVAGQVVRVMAKLRRTFDGLRRDAGIDRAMRDVQDTMRDIDREASIDPEPPPELPEEMGEPEEETSPDSEAEVAPEDRREPEEIP